MDHHLRTSGAYVVETDDGRRLPFQSPHDLYDAAALYLTEEFGPTAATSLVAHHCTEPAPHLLCWHRGHAFAVWHIEDLPEEATTLRAA